MKKTIHDRPRASRHPSRLTGWVVLICLAATAWTAGQDIGIIDHQPWRGYFGGQETVLRFSVHAVPSIEGRLTWRLAVMGRTAARGEQLLAVDANQTAFVDIPLQFPEPKPGVVVDAVLEVGIMDHARTQTLLTHNKVLRLYPENPFYQQTARMADDHLYLFDPETTTADRLTELEVPFTPVSNINALEDRRSGVLIIGEDILLGDYRGLFRQTLDAAARGMHVLYMAPAGGEIEMPGMGKTDLPHPRSVRFHGTEIIHRYDKKLDAVFWPPDGGVAVTGLIPSGDRDRVTGIFDHDTGGWPWIEFQYPSGGRLIICGFGIMATWDAGPTPRFLLRDILNDFRSK